MSRPAPAPEKTRAAEGPREDAGAVARREAAIVRVQRRLGMVTRLGDLAMALAEAVHERAMAEAAPATAALAVRETAGAEPGEEPGAPSETVPSQGASSQDSASKTTSSTARSGGRTRAAPRAQAGVASRGAAQASAMSAGELFARLSDIVRQCLELEIRIEEDLRRLETVPFVTHESAAPLHGPMDDAGPEEARQEDPRQDDARNRVCAMVEAVIEEEAKTWRKARELYAVLRQRLDEDEADRDLASRPDVDRAASLCRDLGLHPNPLRWRPPPPEHPETPPPPRPG